MKPKTIIIIALIFLIIQTTYKVWAVYTSIFGMFIFLGLGGIFVVFIFVLLYQVYLVAKRKFKERDRVVSSLILAGCLSVAAMFPWGTIERDWFRADDILVAWHEGGGNCNATLRLKSDKSFVEESVCFGLSEVSGDYEMIGDTIYFKNSTETVREIIEHKKAYLLRDSMTDTIYGLMLIKEPYAGYNYTMLVKHNHIK